MAIILIHMAYNYSEYRSNHVFGQALNGRYILPAILPLGILAAHYWSQLLARHRQWLTAVAVFVVISTIGGSGLLMMLRNPQLRIG